MSLWGRYDSQRSKLHARAPDGPVREYLQTPFPARGDDALRCPMLALDLETTGLRSEHDDIVSVGWTELDEGRIQLSSAKEMLIRPRGQLSPASVVIHGISDDEASRGGSLRTAVQEILTHLRGRVLLGHHIRMDASFLARACQNLGWGKVAFPCVDTLQLLERTSRLRQTMSSAGGDTLSAARQRFGLPRYPAHDALWDAIAAAELWLCLGSEMAGSAGQVDLGSVVQVWP